VLGVEAGAEDDDGGAGVSVEGCDTAAVGWEGGDGCCAGGGLGDCVGVTGVGFDFGFGFGGVADGAATV
jgi:hypothetical protein